MARVNAHGNETCCERGRKDYIRCGGLSDIDAANHSKATRGNKSQMAMRCHGDMRIGTGVQSNLREEALAHFC